MKAISKKRTYIVAGLAVLVVLVAAIAYGVLRSHHSQEGKQDPLKVTESQELRQDINRTFASDPQAVPQKIRDSYDAALRATTDSEQRARLYSEKAEQLYFVKLYDEAIGAIEEGERLQSSLGYLLAMQKAGIYKDKGDKDSADRAYVKALSIVDEEAVAIKGETADDAMSKGILEERRMNITLQRNELKGSN